MPYHASSATGPSRAGRRRTVPGAHLAAIVSALVALGVGTLPATPAAAQTASFVFSGSGFGHGVGLSQYGAYGMAQEGATSAQIIQHYYTGVSVAPIDDLADLRVNLLHAVPSGTAYVRGEALASGGGAIQIAVTDTAGQVLATVPGAPNQAFIFGTSGTDVTVATAGGPVVASGPQAIVLFAGAPTLLNVAGPGDTFEESGHRYRYGQVDVAVVAGALEVVNQLKLHEEYLRGIAEMPSSWPAAALEAQVVAARTYALRHFQAGQRAECRCHVYDTTADQVFAGWVKEADPTYGARWAAAVDATSPGGTTGLVALYNGAPITANYFSSSGGLTENNEDVWGGTALPYLRSVDDHWSLSSVNPKASWSYTRTAADVATAFGLPDVVSIDLSDRTAGGSVRTASARSSAGNRSTITGGALRSRLGLPGAWLRKPVMRLSGPDRFATAVAIGKVAAPTGPAVVIASGEPAHLVDGLVAAPLAAVKKAPLLLSASGALPDVVAADIDRRQVTTAYLVGGPGALGQGVEDGLRSHGVTTITRLTGTDRYETGLAVARAIGPRPQAIVASGDPGHLVDALAVGGPAASGGLPILLVSRDTVPAPTRQALDELGATSTVVIGGVSVISDATMGQLPSPHRDGGADRFATALAVSDDFSGNVGVAMVTVASGDDAHLVDALPGGTLGHLTLLTSAAPLTPSTKRWLQARVDIGGAQVVGGTSAVSDTTFDSVRAALGG